MTDSILRSYQHYSYTSIVPFPAPAPPTGADWLLYGETQGWAIDATEDGGAVSVIDTTTPANDLSNEPLSTSNLIQAGSSAKYTEWTGNTVATFAAGEVAQEYDSECMSQLCILLEKTATNLALWSNDFTNAAWTKSNMTTALTATGPTGAANSASTLTATAGNATALQAITSGSARRLTSMWVKRDTGSGNIDMTQDNGGTWTTVTVTSSWTRVSLAAVTSANPTVGIRIVTSGDAVNVWCYQHETGNGAVTSSIPTTTATVTRGDDIVYANLSSFPYSQTENTAYCDMSTKFSVDNSPQFIFFQDTNSFWKAIIDFGQWGVRGNIADFSHFGVSSTANVRHQVSFAVKSSDWDDSKNGGALGSGSSGGLSSSITAFRFGRDEFDVGCTNALRIYRFIVVPRQVQTTSGDLITWRYNY